MSKDGKYGTIMTRLDCLDSLNDIDRVRARTRINEVLKSKSLDSWTRMKLEETLKLIGGKLND